MDSLEEELQTEMNDFSGDGAQQKAKQYEGLMKGQNHHKRQPH